MLRWREPGDEMGNLVAACWNTHGRIVLYGRNETPLPVRGRRARPRLMCRDVPTAVYEAVRHINGFMIGHHRLWFGSWLLPVVGSALWPKLEPWLHEGLWATCMFACDQQKKGDYYERRIARNYVRIRQIDARRYLKHRTDLGRLAKKFGF